MVDQIGNIPGLNSAQRSQTAAQASSVRNPTVLNAVQQTRQKSSHAVAPVKIFAVPQSAKSGASSTAKLPRGSLVDVLT